jgi:hypothetical protein
MLMLLPRPYHGSRFAPSDQDLARGGKQVMRMTGTTRFASILTAGTLAAVLLAGAGPASEGRASGGAREQRVEYGPAVARLAAAGASMQAETPSFDSGVYTACATAQSALPTLKPFASSVAGWSDASKLGEATVVGDPVPAAVEAGTGQGYRFGGITVNGVPYLCEDTTGQLDYDGAAEFPPVTATFLAFGFEPVTATAYLTQSGTLSAVAYTNESLPYGSYGDGTVAVVTSQVELRVADITVNGVPLDVGNDCQTTGPLYSPPGPADPDPATDPLLVVVGGDQPGDPRPYYGTQSGGALAGEATIPPFSGCTTSAGEDLDPLLDASLSGPGNYLLVEQGPGCIGHTSYCVQGAPLQALPGPLWIVEDGGTYTGTANAPVTLTTAGLTITCASSTISGAISKAAGPPRGAQDTAAQLSFSNNCAGTNGTAAEGTWTVTQEGTVLPDFYAYTASTGIVQGTIWDVTLDLTGTGVPGAAAPCTIQAAGQLSADYADTTTQLSNIGTTKLILVSTTCPISPAVGQGVTAHFVYQFNLNLPITSPALAG